MRAIFLLALAAVSNFSGWAQGKLSWGNFAVPTLDGSFYEVPIYNLDGRGIGLAPGGAAMGLFLAGNLDVPFAARSFRTTGANPDFASAFVLSGSPAVVPGIPAGEQADIVIRVWIGSPDIPQPGVEWRLTTPPLGGISPEGNIFLIPGLTGWGSRDGSGFVVPEPSTKLLWILGLASICKSKWRTRGTRLASRKTVSVSAKRL